jgi:hypothetical protein
MIPKFVALATGRRRTRVPANNTLERDAHGVRLRYFTLVESVLDLQINLRGVRDAVA